MSFNIQLGDILNDLTNTTNQIDAKVNNISNSTNRLILEMNKNTELNNIDAKNNDLMLKSTQEIMNIFTNFKSVSDNEGQHRAGDPIASGQGATTVAAATAAANSDNKNGHKDNNQNNFEQYKTMVEMRTNQIDREVERLNALRDIVKEISN